MSCFWKFLLAFLAGVIVSGVACFVVGVKLTARTFAEMMAEVLLLGRYEANGHVYKITEVTTGNDELLAVDGPADADA